MTDIKQIKEKTIQWWRGMFDRNNYMNLQRADKFETLFFDEEYWWLYHSLCGIGDYPPGQEQVALVAGILAQFNPDQHRGGKSLPLLMGQGQGGPTFSKNRFKQLIHADSRKRFYREMMSALRIVGTEYIDLDHLIESMWFWNGEAAQPKIKWSETYYGAVL